MLWPCKCLETHALRRPFWCVFSLIQLTVILNASCPVLEEDPKEYRWKGYGGNPFLGVPTVQRKKRPSVWRERRGRLSAVPSSSSLPLSLVSPTQVCSSSQRYSGTLPNLYCVSCPGQRALRRPMKTKVVNIFVYWPAILTLGSPWEEHVLWSLLAKMMAGMWGGPGQAHGLTLCFSNLMPT